MNLFYFKVNKFKFGNYNKKRPAIFLDKDGVIVKLKKNKHYQNNKNTFYQIFGNEEQINVYVSSVGNLSLAQQG